MPNLAQLNSSNPDRLVEALRSHVYSHRIIVSFRFIWEESREKRMGEGRGGDGDGRRTSEVSTKEEGRDAIYMFGWTRFKLTCQPNAEGG